MISKMINIYLPADTDLAGFPDHIGGDFRETPDYKVESSWMFYLMLKNQNIPVQICNDYPEQGILLIHRAFVRSFVWNPRLFVVSMQWDYKRDDRAQLHLVSNHWKTRPSALGLMDRISAPGLQFFVQPPMHPHLVERNPDRGDRFENIAFLGAEKNLEADFQTPYFREKIRELGLKFLIVDDPAKMNDYSEIDAVLAVRKINRNITHKPAQKLINAWRAGVPAILGREMGYQELYHSDLDYHEVDSVEEVLDALKKLRDDPELRRQILESSREKAEDYTPEAIELRWGDLIRDRVIPAYYGWMAMSYPDRFLFLFIRRLRNLIRLTISFIWLRVFRIKPRT